MRRGTWEGDRSSLGRSPGNGQRSRESAGDSCGAGPPPRPCARAPPRVGSGRPQGRGPHGNQQCQTPTLSGNGNAGPSGRGSQRSGQAQAEKQEAHTAHAPSRVRPRAAAASQQDAATGVKEITAVREPNRTFKDLNVPEMPPSRFATCTLVHLREVTEIRVLLHIRKA